jgi:hypothetical protein
MHSPTTLSDIRSFLAIQRHGPPPWSPSEAALDGLLGLLVEKQESDLFWEQLAELSRRLQDRQLHRELVTGSDVLGFHTTDELLRALRESLRAHQGEQRGSPFARQQSNPRSIAGLLMLGLAVACGQPGEDSGSDEGDDACQEAADNGITGEDSDLFCQLVDMIEASGLGSSDKEALLECLPEMGVSQWELLLTNWASMADQEVEEQMENLAESECESVYEQHHHGSH